MSWWIVTQDYPPASTGGVASWASDLAAALHAYGESVRILARAAGDTAQEDGASPWPVSRMRGRSWGRWQGTWALIAGGARIKKGDVVLFATWPLASWLGPLAKRRGAKVGIACHGSDLTRLREAGRDFMRAMGSASAILPVSRFLEGELARLGVQDERVVVLPMAMGVGGARPIAPGAATTLLCVARLTPLKGVDRAARLARALDLPLTVIGDGPEEPALRAAYPEVHWLGRQPRDRVLSELDHAAAILLLPRVDTDGSGAEGLGLCLLEGAALGTPAIGCRTGGVPEATGPGLLLDDPDSPSQSDLTRVRALLADTAAGDAARAWLAAHHGPAHALAVLRAALSAP